MLLKKLGPRFIALQVICTLITIVLSVLKLMGYLQGSWIVVLSPVAIPLIWFGVVIALSVLLPGFDYTDLD